MHSNKQQLSYSLSAASMTAEECQRSNIYLLLAENILHHFNWHLFLKQPNAGTAQIKYTSISYLWCSSVLSDCPISSSPLFPHILSALWLHQLKNCWLRPSTPACVYILTCRSTEQHKPAPQCSILLFDPLWKTTQVKEVNKREKMTTQISTETQQAHLGNMLRAREEKKTTRQQRRKLRYSNCLPATLHLLLFSFKLPFNFPLVWVHCASALPGVALSYSNYPKDQGSGQTMVTMSYFACGSILHFDHLYSQKVLNWSH